MESVGWSLKQMSTAGPSLTPGRADGLRCLARLRDGGLFFGRYLGPGRSVAWNKRGAALPLGMVKDGKVS